MRLRAGDPTTEPIYPTYANLALVSAAHLSRPFNPLTPDTTSEPPPGVNPETLCAYATAKTRPPRAPARGGGLGGSCGRFRTRVTDGDPTLTPKRRRARRN